MGESIVESPNVGNKTRESLASGATLEVSVSFGRFENDTLSWEKWSSFSPNKYLEEVEKCSTPGSVAQKKAYFEAHYKKIAARKAAEQLEQEKQTETSRSEIDGRNGEDHVGNSPLTDTELSIAGNGQSSAGVDQATDSMSSCRSDETNESAATTIECQSSSVDGPKEETDSIPDSLGLNKSEEAVLVQEETHLNGSEGKVELPPVLGQEDTHLNGFEGKEELPHVLVQEDTHLDGSQAKVEVELAINLEKETGNTLENKKNKRLDASDKFQKMTAAKMERSFAGTKKKPTTPLPKKSPEIPTPKPSKPRSTSTVMTTSLSSTKKANGSALPRSTNPYAGESKKVAPSLHMSLSLGPANSDSTSFPTTRKSLIMEKMGDKDIVKRAFKSFQSNFNQVRASDDEKCSGRKEVSTTRPRQKLSTSLTPRKENEGTRKAAQKMDAQRAQLARSWNTTSARSLKGAGMDQRSAKPAPFFASKSGEKAEKRKELVKKPEEKSYAKEVEKPRLSSKSKLNQEEREAEMKKLRQSLSFKATPMPGFYRGQALSKISLDKEGAKNKHHNRPETHR